VADKKVIRIRCPNLGCQRVLGVPSVARGKLVRCRGCGMTIRIPFPKTLESDPEETQEPASESS
jgi:hypothetical protein